MPDDLEPVETERDDPAGDETPAQRIQLRQLALVDRIFGLEAELARMAIANAAIDSHRHETDLLRAEIAELHLRLAEAYGSRTWRAGTAALAPIRKAKALLRRSRASQ